MTIPLPSILQRGAAALLDLVFPPRCVTCGKEGSFLCESCLATAPAMVEPYCHRCARPLHVAGLCETCRQEPNSLDGILSAFAMGESVSQGVYALKYRNLRALAPVMGDLMAAYLQRVGLEVDVLAPVPLHPRRLRQRGYNQAELLARAVGRSLDVSVIPSALVRVRHGQPQIRALSREERKANVADAFRSQTLFDGQRVLLVDDVCTTGATLEACASAVRQAGAAEVWGVTLPENSEVSAIREVCLRDILGLMGL